LGNVYVVVEFSIIKARNAQARMAQKIIAEDKLPREIKLISGVDVAYSGILLLVLRGFRL
jgi:deoxyinosine 3'endonuclease (endonuclease V)